MAGKKGMSKTEISERTKDSSYITLKKNQIVKIVSQLPPEHQKRCFSGEKTMKPLDKVETAYALTEVPDLKKIDQRPISKIPLKERWKIIQDWAKDHEDYKTFLVENNFWQRSQLDKEVSTPGDFSPSGLWSVLDEFLQDLDLSNSK